MLLAATGKTLLHANFIVPTKETGLTTMCCDLMRRHHPAALLAVDRTTAGGSYEPFRTLANGRYKRKMRKKGASLGAGSQLAYCEVPFAGGLEVEAM